MKKYTIFAALFLLCLTLLYRATAEPISPDSKLEKTTNYTIYYRIKNEENMKATQWEYPQKWTINQVLDDIAEHGIKIENDRACVLVTPGVLEAVVIFKKDDVNNRLLEDLTT